MKYIQKNKIEGGHKNKTFKIKTTDGNFFLKIKKHDNFNHKIDYKNLNNFNFVPKLIFDDDNEIIWEFLEKQELILNKENLSEMAQIMLKVHNSKLVLPISNHKARLIEYYEALKHKENIPLEVEQFYETALKIIEEFDISTPLHNDPWMNNFVKTNRGIFLVDWEYASMGDKHFDLAFVIDGSWLNEDQEYFFLQSYGIENYDQEKLSKAKLLVNYLTLVWMHRFDELPFDDKIIKSNLHKNINNKE
ncbi:phosphotransferase [Mycoplasma marinum]|uniref:Aminoglycoside phosphotransferase domain-containing protein n=1 Tax=Mycoplasma marinum TaxID=1937190 RepID=A0A4R0XU22_9MOLU|nr:phosphotransferase [Mycoplasma marinum]TCG10351.1 hypothetical protein C4B24_04750 [Mycoplasma marinum]